MASRRDYAYLAGLMDGDGSIQIAKNNGRNGEISPQYELLVSVTGTEAKIIDYLLSAFGGKSAIAHKATAQRNQAVKWYILARKAELLLKHIKPYIICKGDEIDVALAFRQSFGINHKYKMKFKRGKPTDPAIVQFRDECYWKLKSLHQHRIK